MPIFDMIAREVELVDRVLEAGNTQPEAISRRRALGHKRSRLRTFPLAKGWVLTQDSSLPLSPNNVVGL
jgi:hypothetical protein